MTLTMNMKTLPMMHQQLRGNADDAVQPLQMSLPVATLQCSQRTIRKPERTQTIELIAFTYNYTLSIRCLMLCIVVLLCTKIAQLFGFDMTILVGNI